MTLKLYLFPPSPRAFKVMVVANHLGLPWELEFVDLPAGAHKTPEFAALNPNMRMPVLKEGEFVLWESEAILQYLASKKPESGLLPLDERSRADVARWQFWYMAHWDQACATLIFENVVKPLLGLGGTDPAVVADGEEKFHHFAKVLDGQLRGRQWVTGDTLTIADVSLGAALNLAAQARLPIGPYGEIVRWYADLSALPAWKQTVAQAEERSGA